MFRSQSSDNVSASFYQVQPDKTWLTGIIAVALSSVLFLTAAFGQEEFPMSGLFTVNYLIAVLYLIFLLFKGRLRKGRQGLAPLFVLLVLSLISAYTLNREMNIFDRSTTWWAVFLTIACINYLTLPFFPKLSTGFRQLICLVAGMAFPAFIYLSFYLAPIYALSAAAAFFLGISIHSFVPLLFVLYTLVFMKKVTSENRRLWIGFLTGILLALVLAGIFIIKWKLTVDALNRNYNDHSANAKDGWPAWVYAAEKSPRGMVTERVLKADLVYATYNNHWDLFDWKPKSLFNEAKKHDPLVVLATMFCGPSVLPESDRIKVLESIYDSRHQAQERMWSGEDLVTTRVGTSIEVWPKMHLSYTEKDITVTNKSIPAFWRNQQEALYTFHLPEGAVVSSLSLWIGGHEEKAVLASRKKADSAYKTIVGVVSRDPAVIHWQEGNRVTVRVFPVQSGESRHFKIGITAPLEKNDKDLVYRNTWFDGPSPVSADESVTIMPEDPVSGLRLPSFFPGGPDKVIRRDGRYQADWSFRFRDEGVQASEFGFNGNRYTLKPFIAAERATDFRHVYLDINNSWSRREFEKIWPLLRGKKVYAYDPGSGLEPVTDSNRDDIFGKLSCLQFSLLPISAFSDPGSSLLISKSTDVSPDVADLEGKTFSDELHAYFSGNARLCLFNFGTECSAYLKTLKECGAFRFKQGTTEDLERCLNLGTFPKEPNGGGTIDIDQAGVMIQKDSTGNKTSVGSAPDHLMRLFTYRHIMQQMEGHLPGENHTQDNGDPALLVGEAQEANIVTPVSSLVVLESRDDYTRFDIEASRNGLKNAGLTSKGSVPEPAEWALIAVALTVFFFIRYFRTK
jgi:XrtN system VIT domain protein